MIRSIMKNLIFLIVFIPSIVFGAGDVVFFDGSWSAGSFDVPDVTQLDTSWQNSTGLPAGLIKWSSEAHKFFYLVDGIGTDNWTLSTASPTKYYYNKTDIDISPLTVVVGGVMDYDFNRNPVDWNDYDSIGSDRIYIVSATDPDAEDYGYVYAVVSKQNEPGYQVSSINTTFNNPLGTGGAWQSFIGDGAFAGTGSLRATLTNSETELWIRLYVKDESLKWESISSDKHLYMHTSGADPSQCIPEYASNTYKIALQGSGTGSSMYSDAGYGFPYMNGEDPSTPLANVTADAVYHCWSFYFKMDDTGVHSAPTANGVARFWFDDELLINVDDVNFSAGFADAKAGWKWIQLLSNQAYALSGVPAPRYIDDLVMANSDTSALIETDTNGYKFIPSFTYNPASATTATVKNCTLKNVTIK